MNRRIFLINMFVILMLSCYSQSNIEESNINKYDSIGNKTGIWKEHINHDGVEYIAFVEYYNDTRNGRQVTYFKDGGIAVEAYYKDGLANGIFITYNKTGNIIYIVNYKNDTINGWYYSYWENGNLKDVKEYKNGEVVIGTYRSYYENGFLFIKTYIESEDSNIENFEEFYESGIIKLKGQLVNDKKNGLFIYYDEKGEIIKQKIFKEDELIRIIK